MLSPQVVAEVESLEPGMQQSMELLQQVTASRLLKLLGQQVFLQRPNGFGHVVIPGISMPENITMCTQSVG